MSTVLPEINPDFDGDEVSLTILNEENEILFHKARAETMKACYIFTINFDGSSGEYGSFTEFLTKETEMRSYWMYYMIDIIAKDSKNPQTLIHLLFFASDAIDAPLLMKEYFTETIQTLLKISRFEALREKIMMINAKVEEALENGDNPDLEELAEGTGIKL